MKMSLETKATVMRAGRGATRCWAVRVGVGGFHSHAAGRNGMGPSRNAGDRGFLRAGGDSSRASNSSR